MIKWPGERTRMLGAAIRTLGLILTVLPGPGLAGDALPRFEARPGYVDEAVCTRCHAVQAQAWASSKHRHAMEPVMGAAVLGDFAGATVKGPNATTRLTTGRQGRPVIETTGANGKRTALAVTHTLGVHPLQQYLVPATGGRLQAFTLAWDTVKGQWFDLQADDPARPGQSLHWSGRYQTWNLMCAECHTTALAKAYDDARDRYATTWANPTVGCQACHGPGQDHARAADQGRSAPLPIPTGQQARERQVDACASCHARRTRLIEVEAPGAPLFDNFIPDTLGAGLYHADGQQRAEVFEYGSFRQSRMYQAGVICTDCHDPHEGKPRAQGNALCLRCHQDSTTPGPTGTPVTYGSARHHFHVEGAAGSACVDCHMPATTFMVVHPRRDHAFGIPRPERSARLRAPDACTQCHADKPAAWAQAAIESHFGPRPEPPTHGEVIAMARSGRAGALRDLTRMAATPEIPAIIRATVIEALGRIAPSLLAPEAASDPDPAVRTATAAALAAQPGADATGLLHVLLHDSRRAVRITAARSLVARGDVPSASSDRAALTLALDEFIAAQQAMADMPAAQLSLAGLFADLGEPRLASIHFQRALRQDPDFAPAREGYARWLAQQGGKTRPP